jgi:hypothetical protein
MRNGDFDEWFNLFVSFDRYWGKNNFSGEMFSIISSNPAETPAEKMTNSTRSRRTLSFMNTLGILKSIGTKRDVEEIVSMLNDFTPINVSLNSESAQDKKFCEYAENENSKRKARKLSLVQSLEKVIKYYNNTQNEVFE